MRMEREYDGVSLRTAYIWIIIAAFIISGLVFYATVSLTSTFRKLSDATENQIALDKAAHELMDASDYLTERVQRFTVNGDKRFLDEYFTEAFETNRRENAIAKMSADPNISAALDELQQANNESFELMDREYYAMRLVTQAKGYSDIPKELQSVTLSEQDAALSPEDKMRRATEMVLDDEYYAKKERIRENMKESLDALESLTHNAETEALENVRKTMNFVRAIIVFQILGILFLIWLSVRLEIDPILKAVERVKADRPIQETGAKEFRHLARTYNDLTIQLNRENELLKEISQTDALTGIRNRMALRNDYDSYRGHEVNVMLLDLDDFKKINDSNGHEEGDRILRETGELLIDTFKKEYCYRYGGDEFLVIVPDMSEADFMHKVERMLECRPFLKRDGEIVTVGYSVGYVHAVFDEEHELHDLFSEADQKMYQIKRDKLRSEMFSVKQSKKIDGDGPGVAAGEYATGEMKTLLENVSRMYDLARLVDPIECRILELDNNGQIRRKERCYGIWNADQRCVNCTSAMACRTGCHQEKVEAFDDRIYHIQSNPVRLKMSDGGVYDAVVELVSIDRAIQESLPANNRAAENKNHRAYKYHAQHDSLTGVLNANAFSEFSREAIINNRELSWTMITSNIMNFRLINTLYGSQKGNEVIVRNADLLSQIARTQGGLCGRIGGDQFAMLIPGEKYREELLQNVCQSLKEEFSSGQFTFCIHFGVYKVEDLSVPVSVMCDRANTALQTIQDTHNGKIAYFSEEMMKKSLYEQEIISGFEHALLDGQFRMYLQPLVNEKGEIIGAEALVRWQRPDGSITMPGEFIETLERFGLIYKLDMYIWECAAKQLSLWKGTDRQDLFISVNMSAKDFYNIDVYQVLTGLIDTYNISAGSLRVEITETALLEDPESGNEVISKLKEKGFLVEIDDFGKGNSSLGLLKDIQADVLKIDMSFLHEIDCKKRSRIILESVIKMADSLGMDVVTEGVETETQLNSLITMGCHHFQGYYFSRPITIEEFDTKTMRDLKKEDSGYEKKGSC